MLNFITTSIDSINEIFSHIRIEDLIKFRCVSKNLHILVDNYISKNNKKCDMMAYDCEFLVTPEYLVMTSCSSNTSDRTYRYMCKNYKTIRLINVYGYKYNSKILKLTMPNLKFMNINRYFKTKNIYTPAIKFYQHCDIDISKYDITFAYLHIDNKFKINDRITSVIVKDNAINKMGYFPNIKNVYMISIYSCHVQTSDAVNLYIRYCENFIDLYKMFPKLEKIYVESLSKLMYNGVKIMKRMFHVTTSKYLDKNYISVGDSVYKLPVEGIYPEVHEITIISRNISGDILAVFPNLRIIYLDKGINVDFKLNKLEIIYSNYNTAIKNLVFSNY